MPRQHQARWIYLSLKSKKNLHIFGRYFFPDIIQGVQPVPKFHHDLIAELTRRAFGAVIVPRNHAKTSWEKIDTIHDIVYALEPLILYVSGSLKSAQNHFESIKGELEQNSLLRSVYGDLVPQGAQQELKWTNVHFETTNGVNLVAWGFGRARGINIRNRRPTKIIVDDLESDDVIRTAEGRAKIAHFLKAVIIPARDRKRGFVKLIGTMLHPECELKKFYDQHGGIFRKAIEDGKPIWWSMKELKEEEERIGSLLFRQEYMNEPITESERLVKEAWLKIVPTPPFVDLNGMPLADKYSAVDPAISEKATADYFAMASAARILETGKIVIYKMKRGHYGFPEQVRLIVNENKIERYNTVGIETVAYQKALRQEIDRVGAIEGSYVPTHELHPDTDKVRRLMRVLPYIENGTVLFSEDLPKEFFDELLTFPNGKNDDQVDAFVNVVLIAIEGSQDYSVISL